ncbi:MAG: hypothetical protein U9N84_12355 [Actinomycetota bacterium]|nr:hypothetical protein [Actinomycetota bacterium]
MITERFSRLFGRLLTRWAHYQDAPRNPALVTDLAAARIALDEVRADIAVERASITSQIPAHRDSSRVAVSEEDLDRLRVAGLGLVGNS